jgi:hypothetical protein
LAVVAVDFEGYRALIRSAGTRHLAGRSAARRHLESTDYQ